MLNIMHKNNPFVKVLLISGGFLLLGYYAEFGDFTKHAASSDGVSCSGCLANGSSEVPIFRNKKAMDAFMDFQDIGQIACIVSSGTRATVTSSGFVTVDVAITSGTKAGCRGTIPREWYRR